jgi:DNA-binding SARP family transcriptional activator
LIPPANVAAHTGQGPQGSLRVVEPAASAPGEPRRVRLLGEVRVDGVSLRGQSLALVSFLATHPGATADELGEACWPSDGTDRTYKRLKDLVSTTRSALGSRHFPLARSGKYALEHVVTDLEDFEHRVSAAPEGQGRERAGALRSALSLAEGRVFRYPARNRDAFAWVELEHWVDHWEARIEAITVECAEAYTAAGLHTEAVAMLLSGLETLPLNVALTECLMAIHGEVGDLERVERVFQAHCDGLARVHACEPERSTAELRAQLLTRAHG